MIRVEIVVEGQSERDFVREVIRPYLLNINPTIYVDAIVIRTSSSGRGGFTNYAHLQNDIKRALSSNNNELIVSMFVDFFRIPTSLPNYERIIQQQNHLEQVMEMEKAIDTSIGDWRFIPYIQMYEFEALLFASNVGFVSYFDGACAEQTASIVNQFDNPEEINSSPNTAPSKRLLTIKSDYDKVLEGNLIALEIGMETILARCPRFKAWIDRIVERIDGPQLNGTRTI